MRVLSLFDGAACAYQAMKDLGWKVDQYDASETDQYAMRVADDNHSNIRQLGDADNLSPAKLGKIDLLIAGSPCQDLSIAKPDRQGLKGSRSGLFFRYMDILNRCQPGKFFLENVASMRDEDRHTITQFLGVEPVQINSKLLVPQLRDRLYWTNWDFSPPERKHVHLKDVLEGGVVDRQYSLCIDANYGKGTHPVHYLKRSVRQLVFHSENWLTYWQQMKEGNPAAHKPYMWPGASYREHNPENVGSRLLMPIEIERLQGLPDGYTGCVSKTQRYKILGNGFTVPIISHILSKSGLQ